MEEKVLRLKYSKTELTFELPETSNTGFIVPNKIEHELTGVAEVRRALNEPIGTAKLNEIVGRNERVVIVTSDITRPFPGHLVIPEIIEELHKAGVVDENITIVFALGSHRPHSQEEMKSLVGEDIYNSGISLIDSDVSDCVNLGTCRNGTPVDIFRPVVEADKVICLGNIEFHYFAGYSGGIKAIMPGVSSREAIQANHSNMINENAVAGNIVENPVRQDIDQVADFINIDFILNVVLDDKKQIVKAVAGHYLKAHRAGCGYLDLIYGVKLTERADIVIASPGGYPKDINLYQAQKGLDNAKYAVKDDGIIILVASAAEGFGEDKFMEWMIFKSPSQMISDIQTNFVLGGHKAAAIAMILEKSKIFIVSDLDDETVRKIQFTPFPSVQDAVDEAVRQKGKNVKILVMPDAGSTIPMVKEVL